jgi:hypothetical protein
MPKSSLPSDTTSTVAAILASIAGGRAEAVAGHQQPEAQPLGLRGEGGEQCPALEDWPVGVAADRHEVVKQPRVLDLRDRVRFSPDSQNVAVADLLRGGRDPEPRSVGVRHGPFPLSEVLSAPRRLGRCPLWHHDKRNVAPKAYGALFRFASRCREEPQPCPRTMYE